MDSHFAFMHIRRWIPRHSKFFVSDCDCNTEVTKDSYWLLEWTCSNSKAPH